MTTPSFQATIFRGSTSLKNKEFHPSCERIKQSSRYYAWDLTAHHQQMYWVVVGVCVTDLYFTPSFVRPTKIITINFN